MSTLAEKAIEVATGCLSVRETPPKSNRGPEVDAYLRSVGLDPTAGHFPWCAAYVSWCVREAMLSFEGPAQFRFSASALGIAERNPHLVMKAPDETPCIFVVDHGAGKGHCGFVAGLLPDGRLHSFEGNTNAGPSAPEHDRDGDGVYERMDRRPEDCAAFVRIA